MNERKEWEVWFVPTAKGAQAFNWKEQRTGNADPMTLEQAQFACYELRQEEAAPDFGEFGKYETRKAKFPELTEI